MAQRSVIELFKPADFERHCIDLEYLNEHIKKRLIYASMGRNALHHILKSLAIKDKILVPAYICDTVLSPIKKLGIKPVFYDLEIDDLNASIDSIDFLSRKYSVKSLLVASMYGNPAGLVEIEQFCKSKGIDFIDDAAQSFGAKLDGRYVGTFGNAGFFSFSPGKPTAGHMGAFFWTDNVDYSFNVTNHPLIHYISFLDFYFNRLNIYKYRNLQIFRMLSAFKKILIKTIDISNDEMCNFEKDILGGIVNSILTNKFKFRVECNHEFSYRFSNNDYFIPINSIRGIPNNHKFVLLFYDKTQAQRFMHYMFSNGIKCLNGYKPLTDDLTFLPNFQKINGKVVELSMEDDKDNMKFLFDKISSFIGE